MACKCIECGKPTSCGEKYCDKCLVDKLQTDTEKNLYAGGRFYGEKLIKEE